VIRVLLRLARLSNAPTVASQCLAGAWLAHAAFAPGTTFDWLALLRVTVTCLLAYAGGMILNDVLDERVDRRERPDRPIPSGAIARARAGAAAVACLGAALGIAWIFGHAMEARATVALVVAAVLYDAIHLRTRAATILLGACRGLVYVVAGCGQAATGLPEEAWAMLVAPALFVGAFVTLFSLVARGEADPAEEVASRIRCGRCGGTAARADRACPSCGATLDAATGLGILVARPASGRGAWMEALGILPILAILATLSVHATAKGADFAPVPPALLGVVVLAPWTLAAGRLARRGGPFVGPAIGRWIASISLVDATLLLAVGQPWPALAAFACFVAARLLSRRIAPS